MYVHVCACMCMYVQDLVAQHSSNWDQVAVFACSSSSCVHCSAFAHTRPSAPSPSQAKYIHKIVINVYIHHMSLYQYVSACICKSPRKSLQLTAIAQGIARGIARGIWKLYVCVRMCMLDMETVAEWSWWTYPAPLGAGGVGSIPANADALSVPSFSRRQFEMKLSPL